MTNKTEILSALDAIDPAELDYQDWLNVGMALKMERFTVDVWEAWSRRDPARYHLGECLKKWESFQGSEHPVTAGTIVAMARSRGWQSAVTGGRILGWDDMIGVGESCSGVVVDQNWVEDRETAEPKVWDPARQLITYLEALFSSEDYVGYVTRSFQKNVDGKQKYFPQKGRFDRTAGKLIEDLEKCNGDIGKVLGDYNPKAGAWIRFNPLDGKDASDKHVTDFRFALVESDTLPIGKQNAILRALELPIAALVHSGGKSLHAIVRVDAVSYEDYRKKVDYLYRICDKNGLILDHQNRNPSRLSRMPGVIRDGEKQFLIDTNLGKASWAEWQEWIESINDDLPDPEDELLTDLPELAPALIENVLRQGHKMLLAGPSKAGKSYALIELAVCLAEGLRWMGFQCAQGKVLYVNLELDRASCLHRFRDVRQAMGAPSKNSVDIWNLRGHSIPMDKLAPKLIRRAMKKNYLAVIIDPIYKVITGDENSADQMARFCNQFDKVCTELSCAVIYCHHHSKGNQGGKRSMDRASGSGVFARDPDALLDLIELPVSEDLRKQEINNAVGRACRLALLAAGKLEEVSQDDLCSEKAALEACRAVLDKEGFQGVQKAAETARRAAEGRTAWRIEGTLREFPKFAPVNVWFDFPIHRCDETGVLGDIDPDKELPAWQPPKKSRGKDARQKETVDTLACAFSWCDADGSGQVSIAKLMEHTKKSRNWVKDQVDAHPDFCRKNGVVSRVSKVSNDSVTGGVKSVN